MDREIGTHKLVCGCTCVCVRVCVRAHLRAVLGIYICGKINVLRVHYRQMCYTEVTAKKTVTKLPLKKKKNLCDIL